LQNNDGYPESWWKALEGAMISQHLSSQVLLPIEETLTCHLQEFVTHFGVSNRLFQAQLQVRLEALGMDDTQVQNTLGSKFVAI
jgi:hypothetical protein